MNESLIEWTKWLATLFERLLALGLFVGCLYFAFHSTFVLMEMDWGRVDAFYELIYRILLIVIGVELIRTLVTHDLMAVLELIAFVVARKMLKPDLTSLDILLCAASFAILLVVRRYILSGPASSRKEQCLASGE